ncbi:MAG: endonuclease/exonuclease/phosphatase family protein [Pseudomonadota bacterium]
MTINWPSMAERNHRPLITARRLVRLASAVLFAWSALWLLTGDSFLMVRAGLYLAPLTMVAALVICALAVVCRARRAALTGASVAALIFMMLPPTVFRAETVFVPRPDQFKITTLSNRTLNADMTGTAAMLRQHPADIFVLQEIADPLQLVDELQGLYGADHTVQSCHHGNFVIVTRFPIGEPHAHSNNAAMLCRVGMPEGPVWVAAVHLPKGLWTRDEQLGAALGILQDAADLDGGILLAGDFNATVLTTPLRRIADSYSNAFDEHGSGPGFTFPTTARRLGKLGPFLRIDHIFYSDDFLSLHAQVESWHPPLADHFPVSATLVSRRPAL